jgi:hypothetical protein
MTRFGEFYREGDNPAVDREGLSSAAYRLKHDLGKAVRWNASGAREADSEALRRRLETDLLATRIGPEGRKTAVEIFEVWLSEEGSLFRSTPRWAARLDRLSETVESIRAPLARLSDLGRDELVALDEATLVLQDETRALWQDVIATSGSSP